MPGIEPYLFPLFVMMGVSLLTGITKGGVPGIGILLTPIMALVMKGHEKESVGLLLPILVIGDILAVSHYRRHAEKTQLLRLIPGVAAGLLAGWFVLSKLNNSTMRPALGALILVLLTLELIRRLGLLQNLPQNRFFGLLIGVFAGCASTIGNAAGPTMIIYFVMMGLKKDHLLGTSAWFFLLLNLSKSPIFAMQGMISLTGLAIAILMAPCVEIGIRLGVKAQSALSQQVFDWLVLAFAAAGGIWLLC